MRRPVLLAAAVLALALPAPASAIVAGDPVAAGDFPAQGFLGIDTDSNNHVDQVCSGTLVGSRQFLTAARCTTNFLGQPRSATRLTVQIGQVAAPDDTVVQNVATNDIPEETEGVPGGYVKSTGENDVAMLTLKEPVYTDLTRVVDRDEGLSDPGTVARVLGWGETASDGDISPTLRKGLVTIREDDDCGDGFDAASMLCAAATPANGSHDPCAQDSGSPLLVPWGAVYALAGVFSGTACSTPDDPGHYARVGDDPLNKWIHDRTPEANFDFENGLQPRANVPFALVSTSHPAKGEDEFTTFRWDLDDDGEYDDATGKRIVMTVGTPGLTSVGIEASRPGGDRARDSFSFEVGSDPNAAQPGGTSTPTTPTPAAQTPAKVAPLATILAAKRPKVKRGRFPIRVRFAKAAPSGTAVIEVYRGTRRIGIARTKVKRGATKRVRVKLTPTGRRILRRAKSHRLKIRVRVRVGRQLLRTKQLTIRR
jgi:hypothetical protein